MWEMTRESLLRLGRFCENGSLHTICKNFGKFPENLVALYMSQVLQGLLYLHEQGVIHRDIKGANILTTKEGLVKLADFGVATKSNASEYSVVGTPYWMAPEVIQLSGATTASDIWSLGCTVIELLDGRPPYHNLPPMPALFKIVQDDHPPIPEGVSPAVRDFLMQCFQKDPNLRVSAKKMLKHPWILNAKKTNSVISEQQTKYDAAVKSVQQWNEALKSPDHDSIRKSRPSSLSPMPTRKELTSSRPAASTKPLQLQPRLDPEAFKSPDIDANDVWDDDFATSITSGGLQLAQRKAQDNFNGQLNTENLKSYAQFDGSELDDVRTKQETDPHETVKPITPKKFPTKSVGSMNGSKHKVLREQGRNQKLKPGVTARPASSFQETIEDYSDLVDSSMENDAFLRKVEAMKINEEKHQVSKFPRSKLQPQTGSPVRKTSSMRRNPPEEKKKSSLQRTQSAVEIYKYAEDANEDPEAFLEKDVLLPVQGYESSSERGTLMMAQSKHSNTSVDEEDDYEDPFALLEEDFDQLDLDANVARDRHARLCSQVEAIVADMQTFMPENVPPELVSQLLEILEESPELKSAIISSRGLLPMLEVLDGCDHLPTALRLLKIINLIVFDSVEMLVNLCFVGGIPIVSEYALKRYPGEIRHEAAAFIRQLCQTSTLALQMFVSCGGLGVLVGFLEEDMETERDLVDIGVDGVCSVFELQGPTPKNDFCRLLSRSSILYPLSLALNKLLDERGPKAEETIGKIVSIFLPFSQAENYVKEIVADRMVLKRE
jgi:serine/threonine protein kinase